ncbi:MAG: sigma-70 family RNA polymerase sigma factor [Candidatus Velthaea sp.]
MVDRFGSDEREDGEMVADFLAGRSSGLEAVYRAFGRLLYSVARNVLASDEDAQDCVHDALVRIWQRPGSYSPERGPLRSYLLVSVRNEALTRRRNAARHARIDERLAKAADERCTYELDVHDPIERDRLRRALADLPGEQKAALELAYFGQLTHVQVAQQLGVPLGTTKSRIAMALRKLNVALTQQGVGKP